MRKGLLQVRVFFLENVTKARNCHEILRACISDDKSATLLADMSIILEAID